MEIIIPPPPPVVATPTGPLIVFWEIDIPGWDMGFGSGGSQTLTLTPPVTFDKSKVLGWTGVIYGDLDEPQRIFPLPFPLNSGVTSSPSISLTFLNNGDILLSQGFTNSPFNNGTFNDSSFNRGKLVFICSP